MAPNMKAIERLDDVQNKLNDAEGEAEAAKKESKAARDRFNEVKKERYVLLPSNASRTFVDGKPP